MPDPPAGPTTPYTPGMPIRSGVPYRMVVDPRVRIRRLVDHGPNADRYNLVFISEGFVASELASYRSSVEASIQLLKQTTPFGEYFRYLNIHSIERANDQSGEQPESERLLGADQDGGEVGQVARWAGRVHHWTVAIVVCNFDFRAFAMDDCCFVPVSREPGVTVHELGHSVGKLMDEYEETGESTWDWFMANNIVENFLNAGGWGRNITTSTARSEIPWKHWIEAGTPVPTPRGRATGKVGLFEGGNHMSHLWYRPCHGCLMGNHYKWDRFCPVCREQLVLRLSQRAWPITVETTRRDPDTVKISVQADIPGNKGIRWYRGGRDISQKPVFVAHRKSFPFGQSKLEVRVRDFTPWVRQDPRSWLEWRFHFNCDKGMAWDRGLKIKGPYRQQKPDSSWKQLMKKLERLG